MANELVILGAGGFAREVAWLVSDINDASLEEWKIIGFVEHTNERVGEFLNGIPIIDMTTVVKQHCDTYAVAAIGDPRIRERAVREAKDDGLRFATLIHPEVRLDRNTVEVGSGSIICAGNILTTNIVIGKHVIINLHCTLGHDTLIEDLVTISPGCHLSGHTTIHRGAYVGTGAVTIEGRTIGEYSIIGAGAGIIKDVADYATAVGLPAKEIKYNR